MADSCHGRERYTSSHRDHGPRDLLMKTRDDRRDIASEIRHRGEKKSGTNHD